MGNPHSRSRQSTGYGQRDLDHGPGEERLTRAYSAIERVFVEKGFALIDRKPEPGSVIELAGGALRL